MAIYGDIYDGPPRGFSYSSSKKRYIAIHNTANDATAEGEASYAKRRTDSVSSHYYVDDNSIVQSLDTRYKAWHSGSGTGNTYAISYEITGTNGKSREWWLKNVEWDLLANQIATDMKLWGIDNKHLSISEMRDGKSTGIVTHDDMRRAWGGTTHTDPGPNFPMDHLVKMVDKYLNPSTEDDMFSDSDRKNLEATTKRVNALLEMNESLTTDWSSQSPKGVQTLDIVAAIRNLNNEVLKLKASVEQLKQTGSIGLSLEDLKNTVKEALREGTE